MRSIGHKGANFQSYHPEPTFETYGVKGVDHPLTKRGITGTTEDAAKAFLEDKLSVTPDSISQKSAHTSDAVSHTYFKQKLVRIVVRAEDYIDVCPSLEWNSRCKRSCKCSD